MVEQIDNPVNKNMHGGPCCQGMILNTPVPPPKSATFTPIEDKKQFEQLQQDVYESVKKAPKETHTPFPTILKILGAGIAIASVILFRHQIFKPVKNLFNKIFHRP